MKSLCRLLIRAAFSFALATGAAIATAQTGYPNRPVHLIVPFAPGGTADLLARIVADKMSADLGQSVVVENRAGGGGNVGALEVVRAAADGYTLGLATVSTTAANPAINLKAGYNPTTDYTPIINIAATPSVIAVHPSFSGHDYAAFIAELKRHPGRYAFASAGTGSVNHLQMELFKRLSGTDVTHVPYRGSGPALNDTVAGQVPMIFDNVPSALPFVKEGRLVAIAVAAPQRLAVLPEVPTFKEVGLEPVNRMAFYGILGPAGLPNEVADRVNVAVKKALDDPGVRKRLEESGFFLIGNTPEQFRQQIAAEFELYRNIVAAQKLTLE